MLEPLDRCRRDSTLFQFTSKRLRDFIDPNHLLIQIDEQLDFSKLVAPLGLRYCPDFGRPAIHPETMVRALLICSIYNIASFRRLCSAISENIAYRWFCFLTIDDPVFDHSTITHFINRIGQDGFSKVFDGLNQELLRMGLLSPELYVDSSMVKANVNSYGLSRSGMTVEEFKEQAVEENGLFAITRSTVDDEGVEHEEVQYFQDAKGRLPLSPVDTDARWRTTRPGKPSGLNYQDIAIADRGGFILAREVTHASTGEWKAVPQLLERLPLQPVSLSGDTGYNAGELRQHLGHRSITAYIPIHPLQESNMVFTGGFNYRGHRRMCLQSKILNRGRFHNRDRVNQYVASQKDCQACPVKADCLPPGQKRRYIGLTKYHPLHPRARERNRTAAYRREQKGRRIVSEGAFASLDRLGWARSRLRGLWRVDCEGYMAALAHNVLKAVRWLRQRKGPPVPLNPRAAADEVQATPNACGEPTHTDGPQGSWSIGSLMMSVVALTKVAALLWHAVPPSKSTFSTSPYLRHLRRHVVSANWPPGPRWPTSPSSAPWSNSISPSSHPSTSGWSRSWPTWPSSPKPPTY